MNPSASAVGPRPPLAFRVGVTGSRRLDPDQLAALRRPVSRVLAALQGHVGRLAAEASAAEAYAPAAAPILRLVSPLAEGADRLVAAEARALGYRLVAPLPFAREEYEKDFAPGTAAAFDDLLGSAQVFALDGGRGADETASYEAVGRFVVRNCDLLIALWDGRPARGRGGTAEIVRFAAGARVPVWWIDLAGEARLVLRSRDLRRPDPPQPAGDAEAALLAAVGRIVLPPAAPRPDRHGPIGGLAHHAARLIGRDEAPLKAYLDERAPRPARGFARVYEAMYGLLAPKAPRSGPPLPPPVHRTKQMVHHLFGAPRCTASKLVGRPIQTDESSVWVGPLVHRTKQMVHHLFGAPRCTASKLVGRPIQTDESSVWVGPLAGDAWWRGHHDRADALSVAYGDLYRSSYVLIIVLAFLALAVSALGGLAHFEAAPWLPMAVELCLLLVIGGLVGLNHLGCWQERWITYRLLAELCRKQMVLAPLGRALPGIEVARSAAAAGGGHRAEPWREAWVGWYVQALQRAAPPPEGAAATAVDRALAAGRDLVDRQGAYHRGRQHRAHLAERRLAALGERSFAVTVVGLAIGLAAHAAGTAADEGIEAAAIVLSGASAGFVGLKAYSEFGLLVRQSQRMDALMAEMREEIDAVDLAAPLASQRLGAVLHRLAMAMMQEVSGWAELFRLKAVETS